MAQHRALIILLSVVLVWGGGCGGPKTADPFPDVPREFRGVWVASVSNIDWPSEPGLSSEAQKAELRAILDRAAGLNLNAVVLQVRPAADALYASRHEPWSEYLTGRMGQPPDPYYDPLQFAVREAHRRGLELHAWFNPFRARHESAESDPSSGHISETHPELVREYGDQLWLDPGEPAVRRHSLAVIRDVVRRYEIDGVHFDDYFYPYPIRGEGGDLVEFPDDRSWRRYKRSGGELGRDDWRRRNVDLFVRRVYEMIKREKRHVALGISPFGIWKPGHPPQIKGFNAYERLYADARKWLVRGWCDYLTPQLYWEIADPDQGYTALLRWWSRQNRRGRHIWPGLYSNRNDADETRYQIEWTRILLEDSGNVLFSARSLMGEDGELAEMLRETVYDRPALPPASPWLSSEAPAPPRARVVATGDGAVEVEAAPASLEAARLWVVQVKRGDAWGYDILPAGQTRAKVSLPGDGGPLRAVVVSAVDRAGVQSRKVSLGLPGSGGMDER